MNNNPNLQHLIPPHSGYRTLQSYQMAEIVCDATAAFCNRFVPRRARTYDQMVQAARSGKQNIAGGGMASGTSKKTELKLVGVAHASLEELLLDFEGYPRQHGLEMWGKGHQKAVSRKGATVLEAMCGSGKVGAQCQRVNLALQRRVAHHEKRMDRRLRQNDLRHLCFDNSPR